MLRDVVTPSSNQNQIKQDSNGVLLFFDNSRSKFLSASRQTYKFGVKHRNVASSRWLNIIDGIPTNVTGYKIPRNATITSITIQCSNNTGTTNFIVRKNDNPATIYSSSLSTSSNSVDNLNVDIDKDDWLQIFMSVTSGAVDFPLLVLELAWRE